MKKMFLFVLVLTLSVFSIHALDSATIDPAPSEDFASWSFPLEYGDWASETDTGFGGGCYIGFVSCGTDSQCDLACGSCGPRYFGKCIDSTATCSCFPIENR